MNNSDFLDYYALLEVAHNATAKQITKAYRKIALAKHPDRNRNDPNADRVFAEIVEAKEILLNPRERAKYDIEYAKYQQRQANYALQQKKFANLDKERQILITKLNAAEKEHQLKTKTKTQHERGDSSSLYNHGNSNNNANANANGARSHSRSRIARHLIEQEKRAFARLIEAENNRKLQAAIDEHEHEKKMKRRHSRNEQKLQKKYSQNCVIVRWNKASESSHIYSAREFKSIFLEYGKIEFVDVLPAKYCAQIVFKKRRYAMKCMRKKAQLSSEFGLDVELKQPQPPHSRSGLQNTDAHAHAARTRAGKSNRSRRENGSGGSATATFPASVKNFSDLNTATDLWQYVQKPRNMSFKAFEQETFEMLFAFSNLTDHKHDNDHGNTHTETEAVTSIDSINKGGRPSTQCLQSTPGTNTAEAEPPDVVILNADEDIDIADI